MTPAMTRGQWGSLHDHLGSAALSDGTWEVEAARLHDDALYLRLLLHGNRGDFRWLVEVDGRGVGRKIDGRHWQTIRARGEKVEVPA